MAGTGSSKAPHHQILSATYTSPANPPFTHKQNVPSPASNSVKDRTAYLGALRKATAVMQEHINAELTGRMEEDKARAAKVDAKASAIVDEAKEEDNYGEEVAEEGD